MHKFTDNRKFTVILITIIIIAGFIAAAAYSLYSEREKNIEHGLFILGSEANKIQYSIDSRLLNLQILEMLIVENGGMISNFDSMAELIYKQDPSIRCLQIAPDGVVTYIYPLEGNEAGFGDLFANPKRRDEAIYARDTGNMTLAGPFELNQGGVGVVARRPIYLEDDSSNKEFWGFTIQVMDLEELLNISELNKLSEDGYLYQISRYPIGSDEKHVFAGEESMPPDTITTEISVPGNTWYLSIIPKEGWLSKRIMITALSLIMLVSILLSIIAYYMIKEGEKKHLLTKLANTDPLTGLYNSRHFYNTLKTASANKSRFILYYIDLDKFKSINDTFGHAMGDELLKETAERIRSNIRTSDYAFRIGGDEFTIILYVDVDADPDFCSRFHSRLESAFSKPFVIDNRQLDISASCGYAVYPDDSENIENLLKIADTNMYQVKSMKH